MMTILLIGGCIISLVMLVIMVAAIIMVVQLGQRDTVSTAREDWIQRRSDKDEQGW